MNTQIIVYIVGGLMVLMMALPLVIKQYYISKTKGKMLVRTVQSNGEERTYLLKTEGSTTELNKRKRAYIPKSKVINPATEKPVGNIATTWYPEGLPRPFQVRLQTMTAPEGNPLGVNFYSDERLLMTDYEVGTVHGEAYSRAVMETSNDAMDLIKNLRNFGKGINKTVVYIMLGIAIIGIIAIAYLSFQNGQALESLSSMWGW